MKTKTLSQLIEQPQEAVNVPEMPANWDECTPDQLRYLAEHGAYGQRLTARRYLADLAGCRP